jgi:hypothetical protein
LDWLVLYVRFVVEGSVTLNPRGAADLVELLAELTWCCWLVVGAVAVLVVGAANGIAFLDKHPQVP